MLYSYSDCYSAMICRRRDRSLIGKAHRHYIPSQRAHNHQWSMVINNLSDDDVKPVNCRYHQSTNTSTCSASGSVVKTKDQTSTAPPQSRHADDDWTAAGRRLLVAADDNTNSPVRRHAMVQYGRPTCHSGTAPERILCHPRSLRFIGWTASARDSQ